MRIGFPFLGGSGWTGGAHYVRNLCVVLREYGSGALEPVILVPPGTSRVEVEQVFGGTETPILSPPTSIAGERARWLKALFLGKDPAIARWLKSASIDVLFESRDFFGWRPGTPVLSWVPDFQDRRLPHLFPASSRRLRSFRIELQALAGRTIMLSSRAAERDCHEFYPRTMGQTVVVRFAVPPGSPIEPDTELAVRYGLPSRFLFLPNQFWKHKNHMGVVEALGLIGNSAPDLVIAVSGNPNSAFHAAHHDEVAARARELQLKYRWHALGMIPYEHVVGLMRQSCALLNPSFFEGWSTTVEEAKSLGVPLVLSDIDVHREQATESAIFFDPSSASSIADGLLRAWHRFSAPGTLERAVRAARDAEERVRSFAREFEAAVARAGAS